MLDGSWVSLPSSMNLGWILNTDSKIHSDLGFLFSLDAAVSEIRAQLRNSYFHFVYVFFRCAFVVEIGDIVRVSSWINFLYHCICT